MSVVYVLLGAVTGLGFWVVLMTLDDQPLLPARDRYAHLDVTDDRDDRGLRFGVAAVAGVAMAIVSWPIVGGTVALAVVLFWGKLGSSKQARADADEAGAFAGWSEQVYSAIRAGNGTNTAIKAAADHAHPLIKDAAARLASRLENESLTVAVSGFARDLQSPAADPVCAAIILSSEYGSTRLTEMMKLHAEQSRRDAQTRLEISASRAQTRTAVRATMIVVVATMASVRILAGELFDFYDTAAGTAVLVVVSALFLGAFALLAGLVQTRQPRRYFTGQLGRSQ